VIAVLAGLVALDVWLFLYHGVAQSLREVLYSPALLMLMLGLVILSAAFHECGHATACAYGGARPGVMGAGLYIVWPAFYTDVTDAYRLGKGGRLRTDLGGVYFNVIFILITAGVYAVTGYEPLLLIIPFQHLEIAHQFLPFIRLDGYYIVSDLTGVPDMFSRIKPTLASFLPWRKTSDRVTELKPWVRGAVTLYVLIVVPLLLFMFTMMVINAPRVFSTAWDSFFVQYHKVQHAFNGGSALHGVIGSLQMLILVLPAVGIVATFWMATRRVGGGIWRATEGRDPARAAYIAAVAAGAGALAYLWWPNGEYRPIQPGERGTVLGAVKQLSAIPSGRPALTPTRLKDLNGAPPQSSVNTTTTTPGQQNGTPTLTNRTTTSEGQSQTPAPTPTVQTPSTTTLPTATSTATTTTPTDTATTATTP
jgi:putative peptide zinc metalloprotease protein